jgi:hypothetical protein
VYAVWRATPTALAASAGVLPANHQPLAPAEGSGFGFRTLKRVSAEQAESVQTCEMLRPL